jgi:hypothetical protein
MKLAMHKMDPVLSHNMDKRALSSLFMFFSFILLVPSGIAMHIAAQLSAEKLHHVTMAAHGAAALIFLASAVIHLILNWKAIARYMLSKAKASLPLKKEAVIAACLTILIVLLVGSHPFHLG